MSQIIRPVLSSNCSSLRIYLSGIELKYMKNFLKYGFLSLLLSCSSGKVTQQYIDFDDREPVTASEYPYSAIGLLESANSSILGTGIVVHSRLILTAAHVAEGLKRGDTYKLETKNPKKPFVAKVERVFIPKDRPRRCAYSDNQVSQEVRTSCLESDFAIIVLDVEVPVSHGRFRMLEGWIDQYKNRRFELQSAGFGISSTNKNYLVMTKSQKACEGFLEKSQFSDGHMLIHNCKSYPGDSGGPLYVMGSDGEAYVLSLAVAAIDYRDYLMNENNLSANIKPEVYNSLQKPIGEDGLPLANLGLILSSRHIDFIVLIRDSLNN